MPKVINDELKLKALRDYLNPGETIRSIAKKYGISYTAMQSYLHEIEDYDLRLDVEAKLLSSPGCNREQIDIWSRAKDKTFTRRQLIDFYIDAKGADNITVSRLIEIARKNGVKIITS